MLVVRVNPGDHRVVTNEATVASDVLDPDLSNNTASATTTVRIADLGIVKASDAATYKPSAQITYTITVVNNGPGNAENVVVTDPLPLSANDRVAILDPSLHARRLHGDLQPGDDGSADEPDADDRDRPEGQDRLHHEHRDRREHDVRPVRVEQLVDEGRPVREPAQAVGSRLSHTPKGAARAAPFR